MSLLLLFTSGGGQVPTKNWMPQYAQDDASVWLWPPQISQAILVTTTQVKFFGQSGQAPTKNWSLAYTYDDAAFWEGEPEPAAIIPLLTKQLFYAAGGQSPTKQWHDDFDDAAVWRGSPLVDPRSLLNLLVFYTPAANAKAWTFGLDDAAVWSGGPSPSTTIHPLLTAAGPVIGWLGNWDFYLTENEKVWQYTFQQNTRFIPAPVSLKNIFTFGGIYTFNIPSDDPELLPLRPSRLIYIPKLLFKRIANALSEARMASASKENRTANAPSETRTSNAPSGDV